MTGVERGEDGIEVVLVIEPGVGIIVVGADSMLIILHFHFDIFRLSIFLRT